MIRDRSKAAMAGGRPNWVHTRNTIGHRGKNTCSGNEYPCADILKYS